MPRNKAVFVDRDGTVSVEMGYIHEKDLPKYELIPGAADGLKKLQAAGYKLILVTNQSGVARGYYPESQVHAVHARMEHLLSKQGVRLSGIYYCPHHPSPGGPADTGEDTAGVVPGPTVPELAIDCDCRKPKAGMGLKAAKEHDIELSQSWMVGDKNADMGFAKNLGVRAVLVKTGYGEKTSKKLQDPLPLIAADLNEAADLILGAK